MSRIFISYRRQDSPAAVGRIFDHLENHFGRDSIFKDVNALKIGDDFRERLNAEVEQCQILLAVIGRNWLNAKGSDGRRRLENPADWVRLEIQTALNRNVPVIPILLDGVEMPAVADMPKDLHPLAYRHAARVRNDPDFRRDIEHVMRGLDRILAELPLPKTAAELTYNSHREPSFPRADLFSVIDVAGEFSEQSSVLPVLDTLASAPSTESDAEVSSNDS
ncbi:MAG: toll/interleukin-1 receptor domain-containing protein [Cyanobacteria bacterium J06598_3]